MAHTAEESEMRRQMEFYSDPLAPSPHQQAGGLTRGSAALWLVFSLLGLAASAILYYEELVHRAHPNELLGCSLNSVINCADAMDAWQGHLLFGVANSVWGMCAFALLALLGFALLCGLKLPRLCYWLLTAGAFAGVGLVCWFVYQSLFVLQALCPYCMVVWATVICLACYFLALSLRGAASVEKPLTGLARAWVGWWWVASLLLILGVLVGALATFGPSRVLEF